jgi:ATP-binding cassette, subfamily B, multidrug efflux pump
MWAPTPTLAPEWILRGVSFTIAPGETAAIVGHTGAGKTTITSLMMRFYDVQHGQVLVDGVDVRDQDLTALRRRFGVVLQDPFLFTGTIADNIRLGSEWITDAARTRRRRGEHRRLHPHPAPAVQGARPRARRHPLHRPEAAHQLRPRPRPRARHPDPRRGHQLRRHRDRITASASPSPHDHRPHLVLIAHRLSTVQSADTILVMHKGQLRERGTHQQLLAQRGLYYKLYQLQYKDQEISAGRAPADGLKQPEVAARGDD